MSQLKPRLPSQLEAIIEKALEKDRNLRYQHAADLRTDLRRLNRDTEWGRLTGLVSGGQTRAVLPSWRKRPTFGLVGILLLCVTLAAVFYGRHRISTFGPVGEPLMQSQDISGDWQGTLNAGTTQLRLILHITKDNNGNLKATMDSIDQRALGIPVSSISLKNSKLKFEVAIISGSYQGKLSADASKISGSWYQGAFFDLDFERAKAEAKSQPKSAPPSDIDGTWMGAVDAGGIKLRIVFHITNTADGLTATADSPDQGAKGIPVTAVTRKGSSLRIEMQQISGVYEGRISADLATIDGTWTQGGSNSPLVLRRVKGAAGLERRCPQNPVNPLWGAPRHSRRTAQVGNCGGAIHGGQIFASARQTA